jgi:hypothetical protein
MSAATAQLDVTAMDDDNKVYISDMPDASGDFSGFYDDATAQTYTAAIDGLPRKFYLYPNKDTATSTGSAPSTSTSQVNGGVGEAVACRRSGTRPRRCRRSASQPVAWKVRVGDKWRNTDDLTLDELEAVEAASRCPVGFPEPVAVCAGGEGAARGVPGP